MTTLVRNREIPNPKIKPLPPQFEEVTGTIQYSREELEKMLTVKQKMFCNEYIMEWNARQAYIRAYKPDNPESAATNTKASMLLRCPWVRQWISFILHDYEYATGVNKQVLLRELKKIALSTHRNMRNDWIALKDWEEIKRDNPDILDAVASIETKIETPIIYNPETDSKEQVKVHYVKVQFYDKLRAIDTICKMMGYLEPTKVDLQVSNVVDISTLTDEERLVLLGVARRRVISNE